MKDTHVTIRIVLFATVCMIVGLSMGGCKSTIASNPTVPTQPPPAPSRSVEEIDNEISHLSNQIEDYKKYQREQQAIGVINQIADNKSRSWIKEAGIPSHEEVAETAYAQAAATEKVVTQLEKKLAKKNEEKQAALKQSTGCFLPDTLVKMEDGTLKPFASIKPGDRVLTYDIGYETVVGRPVLELYSVEGNHLYTINGELITTGGERLLSDAGWKEVRNLQVGDIVHVDGSMITVATVDYQRADVNLLNMQVADTHDFYIATTSGATYLVHNSGGGGGDGGGGGK